LLHILFSALERTELGLLVSLLDFGNSDQFIADAEEFSKLANRWKKLSAPACMSLANEIRCDRMRITVHIDTQRNRLLLKTLSES